MQRSQIEAIGLVASGVATTIAVVAIIAGASTLCMLATMAGLAALWPSIHEGSKRR